MTNLFWNTPKGTKLLLPTPFKTEADFEKIVYENSELMKDIFLLKRQIRGGNKSGIPDMVGIDTDGNICIVEMKNVPVDASIIPQVLQYAFWAETNPDSIKSLWLESDNRPEVIQPSWEKIQIRIVIIAPEIQKSTLDLVEKINYIVDLIEIRRWVEDENEILMVNKLEPEIRKTARPVSGQPVYDEKFYKSLFNKTSVDDFLRYTYELEKYVNKQDWPLSLKFNKHYTSFKAGFFNAFGIKWIGTKTFAFFFKLDESEAKAISIKMTKYDSQWGEAVYYIEPGKTKIKDYAALFSAAFRKLNGD